MKTRSTFRPSCATAAEENKYGKKVVSAGGLIPFVYYAVKVKCLDEAVKDIKQT
ncbi:hypothetical protein SAMN05518683_102109 [Salibacterium halotolerans]|uniref:Uncharacterized protein n=1 Tax=Salibacterium halotolerans TaxID=1884432 RepID=A0A1I5M7B0_9BACI|nr:hypothetical protein SAMN05518683_102109 [Salibacterium halotolerans]